MLNLEKYPVQWVPINEVNIENRKFRFRQHLNPDAFAVSLAEEGQKFPILIWQRFDGSRQLISGFRRITAAQSLNWEKILAFIIPEADMEEEEALRVNFIENIERKTLSALDVMLACKKLSDEGCSNREIGRLIGKSEATVRRYLKVASAPKEIQDAVKDGRISVKHVDAIIQASVVSAKEGARKTHGKKGGAGRATPEKPALYQEEVATYNTHLQELKGILKSESYIDGLRSMMSSVRRLSFEIPDDPDFERGLREAIDTMASGDAPEGSLEAGPDVHDRMYVRPVEGGGFDLVLKFRPKKDDINKAIEFLSRNMDRLNALKQKITGSDGRPCGNRCSPK